MLLTVFQALYINRVMKAENFRVIKKNVLPHINLILETESQPLYMN